MKILGGFKNRVLAQLSLGLSINILEMNLLSFAGTLTPTGHRDGALIENSLNVKTIREPGPDPTGGKYAANPSLCGSGCSCPDLRAASYPIVSYSTVSQTQYD